MNDLIDKAIKTLCGNIDEGMTADAALKYTQAILNLANVQRALNPGDHVKAVREAQRS